MEELKLYLKPNLKFFARRYEDAPQCLVVKLIAYTEYCKKQGIIETNEFILDLEEIDKIYNYKKDIFNMLPKYTFLNALSTYNYKVFSLPNIFSRKKYCIVKRFKATESVFKSTIKKYTESMLQRELNELSCDSPKLCTLVTGKRL